MEPSTKTCGPIPGGFILLSGTCPKGGTFTNPLAGCSPEKVSPGSALNGCMSECDEFGSRSLLLLGERKSCNIPGLLNEGQVLECEVEWQALRNARWGWDLDEADEDDQNEEDEENQDEEDEEDEQDEEDKQDEDDEKDKEGDEEGEDEDDEK